MTEWIVYGGAGLMIGLLVRHEIRGKLWLFALGCGMVLTALLCWLAVIDVDLLRIEPLHGGIVIGGVLFGAAVGLCGRTTVTTLCGIGGGRWAESLCCAAGCAAGLLLVRWLPVNAAAELFTPINGTLFRLTLTDPWLLRGGVRGLAILGAAVCAASMLIRAGKEAEEVPELSELELLDILEDDVEETDGGLEDADE